MNKNNHWIKCCIYATGMAVAFLLGNISCRIFKNDSHKKQQHSSKFEASSIGKPSFFEKQRYAKPRLSPIDRAKIGPHFRGLASVPELDTERLTLRGITESDLDDLFATLEDYETIFMLTYMPWPFTKEDCRFYLQALNHNIENGSALYWAITTPSENKLMGVIGLTIRHEHSKAELHYWLGKPFWGKGYMTEAVQRVVDYVFSTLQLNRLEVNHLSINTRSQRVLEKCGFRLECEKEEFVKKEGKFENLKFYRILKREYNP